MRSSPSTFQHVASDESSYFPAMVGFVDATMLATESSTLNGDSISADRLESPAPLLFGGGVDLTREVS